MPSTSNRLKQMKLSLSRSSLASALLLAGLPGATPEGPRLHLLRSAFASMADLVAIAIILDVSSQFQIFREFHPVAVLLVGPVVIALPFSLSRALGNRIARGRAQQAAAASRPG